MDDFSFGERELDVMAVLWQHGSGTVAEVRGRLPADLAYTTVLTILRNLEAKGFLRHEEEGKAHRYFPLIPQSAASHSALSTLIGRLFGGSPVGLVAHLVDSHELSTDEMRRLQALLTKRLAEREED